MWSCRASWSCFTIRNEIIAELTSEITNSKVAFSLDLFNTLKRGQLYELILKTVHDIYYKKWRRDVVLKGGLDDGLLVGLCPLGLYRGWGQSMIWWRWNITVNWAMECEELLWLYTVLFVTMRRTCWSWNKNCANNSGCDYKREGNVLAIYWLIRLSRGGSWCVCHKLVRALKAVVCVGRQRTARSKHVIIVLLTYI